MLNWKRVRVTFPTVKLGQFIEPVKGTVVQKSSEDCRTVYGVTNVEGITVTGKKTSKDVSNYIAIDKGCFVYNPYRVNVGSIGFNSIGFKGCVSPAYVVFRTKSNLSSEFLYAYLKSEFGNHLINWYGNRGGVRNALRYDDLCEVDIPAIDYGTQLNLVKKIDQSKDHLDSFSNELSKQLGCFKRLRQAIIQEAIEGKLTAEWRKQNPKLISGENHASKLLERIQTERDQLVKDKKTKAEFSLHNKAKDQPPFMPPSGWIWTRAWNVIWCYRGHNPPKIVFSHEPKEGFIRFIQITDFKTDSKTVYVPNSKNLKFVHKGEIVMAAYRHIGKLSRDMDGAFNVALCKVMNIPPFDIDYLELLIKSRLVTGELLAASKRGHIPSMHTNHLLSLWLPIPALAEQKAIVKCVNKLFATISDLENQASNRKKQSEQLMQSVLREAFGK